MLYFILNWLNIGITGFTRFFLPVLEFWSQIHKSRRLEVKLILNFILNRFFFLSNLSCANWLSDYKNIGNYQSKWPNTYPTYWTRLSFFRITKKSISVTFALVGILRILIVLSTPVCRGIFRSFMSAEAKIDIRWLLRIPLKPLLRVVLNRLFGRDKKRKSSHGHSCRQNNRRVPQNSGFSLPEIMVHFKDTGSLTLFLDFFRCRKNRLIMQSF